MPGRNRRLAVLNHTINSGVIAEVKINDRPVGEIELNAALAAEYGVPVAMVSGDARACAEAKAWMPHIETAVVMEAVGTYAAKVLSPAKAHATIREAVTRSLARLGDMRPSGFISQSASMYAFKIRRWPKQPPLFRGSNEPRVAPVATAAAGMRRLIVSCGS